MPAAEMNSQSKHWAALTFAMLAWWAAVGPAQAHATNTASCPKIQQPGKVNVNSRLLFNRKNPEFVEVWQETSVAVPRQNGEFADDLILSPNTPKYQHALHCLLFRSESSPKSIDKWHPEWQSVNYEPSKQKDMVALRYESWNLIRSAGEFEVGPWVVMVAPDADWIATLHPSDDLINASWRTIAVDPGGLEISDASGASTINKDSRVWSAHKPNIYAKMVPPRDLSLSRHIAWIASLGVASWWVCASAVIAASALALLLRRDSKKSDGATETPASRILAHTALQWSGLSAALGLTLLLLLQPSPSVNPWRAFIGISAGLTLVLLARPWLPLNRDSDSSQKRLKRRKVVVATSAATAAAVGVLVIIAPHLFGLPPNLMPRARPPTSGIIGLVLLDLSVLWLWLTAMVSWAWRFAREGRLGERSSGTDSLHPNPVNGRKSEYRRLWLTAMVSRAWRFAREGRLVLQL